MRHAAAAGAAALVAGRDAVMPSLPASPSDLPALVWKSDGNCCNLPVKIWSARLASDGRSLTSAAVELLHDDHAWEQGVIEGPSMVRTPKGLQLLFSGGRWDTTGYGTAVASCDSPSGPCHETSAGPFLSSGSGREGSGGG